MKTHIFIATTRGLVAIQNITALDDPDISSVVSVNGTSTTANISGSYHNFVKKGVGIIHQMFGSCSYRVDISARIDQGNSWQLAMYLAHLAHSKGVLGKGDVAENDCVICATGEVNTSNQQVLAVDNVDVKFSLAESQLTHWSESAAQVHFLIPQANQVGLDKHPVLLPIEHLDQAAAIVLSNTSINPKPNKSVSTNSLREILGASIIIAVLIFFGVNHYWSTSHNQAEPKAARTSLFAQPVQLQALLKKANSCQQITLKSLPMTNNTFTNLPLESICELLLKTGPSIEQVLLVAQDAYTILPLVKKPQGWQIPLPKNRLSDRPYFLVTLTSPLSDDKIEQLRLYRETMPKPSMLTETLLLNRLKQEPLKAQIYSHQLMLN